MKFGLAATLLLACVMLASPDRAEAQQACETYRVKQGDTLQEIAKAAYGFDNHLTIWRENRREIGRNPNIVRVGAVLKLPCVPGQKIDQVAQFEPSGATISFVTANGYLPYTDESLVNRGLMTHLVATAMRRSSPETPVEVVFVNDWTAHLEALLPRQAFDASFPWTRPGCETQGTLTTMELYACQNFVYSDPFYEIVDGFFSRTGSGLETIISFEGLEGATICRPEGYSTGHLEENGLMPPAVELVQPASPHACFEMLMENDVDLVALDTRTGERVMQDLNLTFQVSENPHLFSIQPMQVALHRDNPKTDQLIKHLNAGIAQMLESGEWAAIVSEGLRGRIATGLVN